MADNRPLDIHKLNGRISFRFGNFKFKISSLFTGYLVDDKFQDDKLLKQPIDRLKFSLQNEKLVFKYGDHSFGTIHPWKENQLPKELQKVVEKSKCPVLVMPKGNCDE